MYEDFIGTYDHSLDNKGRVIIPSAFRERLDRGFTVTMNSEWKALAIYPSEKWSAITAKLSRMRVTDSTAMAYKRLVSACASKVDELDSQGRTVLPKPLRDRAGLNQRIVFIGMGDYIEVWDVDRYAAYESDTLGQMDALVAYVDDKYGEL